jgi:cobalt-zinc-cadmium efflux system membrane fusion protein
MSYRNLFAGTALALVAVSFFACSKSADKTAMSSSAASEEGHSHEGWWCNEHGMPEEVCAQCDSGLVADFKAKGDWCAEHNRPDSQCFVCHPEKEAEFAALYEAKYGKQPPKPMVEGEEQEHPAEDKQS